MLKVQDAPDRPIDLHHRLVASLADGKPRRIRLWEDINAFEKDFGSISWGTGHRHRHFGCDCGRLESAVFWFMAMLPD